LGGVSNLNYHLVWCPKYRLPVLVDEVAKDLHTLLEEKAQELGVEAKHIAVKPDHVHMFVMAPPEYSPAKLANQFKGYSSRILRQRYRHLRSRMPSLWSRSFLVYSSGTFDAQTLRQFVEQQLKRTQ
jgi:putative transposase